MNIKKHGLRFHGSFTYRNRTDEIIWHHAEANCTVEDIHSWHLNNGWIGCGYNLIIYKDGTVHEGRPLNAVGAHASGHNSRSVGVCCIGRYDIETMPQAQLDAARQVQAYLKGLYPGAATKRHKDVNATSCPGKNFPFSEIAGTPGDASAEASTVGQGISPSGNWYARLQTECNAQGFSTQKVDGLPGPNTLAGCPQLGRNSRGRITALMQERLIALGYSCGPCGADGINGAETQAAIKAFQRDHGLAVDGIVGQKTWSKLLGLS